MHFRPLFAWLLVAALSSSPAWGADSPTDLAQQRFQEAMTAYREGRYSAAASLFEAADRLTPHASTRYNAAKAWEHAGETARAATAYEAVLGLEGLDDKRRNTARERLDELKQNLARLRVRQPLGALVTVDHVQRAPVPTLFYLRPGPYELRIEYRNETFTNSAEVAAGEDRELELDIPFSALPPAPLPSEARPPEPPPEPPLDREASKTDSSRETWGWIAVGAGVVLSGAAIYFGVEALSANQSFKESGNKNAELHTRATDLRLTTNVLWGGAAAAGATGLVLLLTAPTVEF